MVWTMVLCVIMFHYPNPSITNVECMAVDKLRTQSECMADRDGSSKFMHYPEFAACVVSPSNVWKRETPDGK